MHDRVAAISTALTSTGRSKAKAEIGQADPVQVELEGKEN